MYASYSTTHQDIVQIVHRFPAIFFHLKGCFIRRHVSPKSGLLPFLFIYFLQLLLLFASSRVCTPRNSVQVTYSDRFVTFLSLTGITDVLSFFPAPFNFSFLLMFLLFFPLQYFCIQTVPSCQNLYKNAFTYFCPKVGEEGLLPLNECVNFIGESADSLRHCGCSNLSGSR